MSKTYAVVISSLVGGLFTLRYYLDALRQLGAIRDAEPLCHIGVTPIEDIAESYRKQGLPEDPQLFEKLSAFHSKIKEHPIDYPFAFAYRVEVADPEGFRKVMDGLHPDNIPTPVRRPDPGSVFPVFPDWVLYELYELPDS
jgi:hypothetical protein